MMFLYLSYTSDMLGLRYRVEGPNVCCSQLKSEHEAGGRESYCPDGEWIVSTYSLPHRILINP